MSAKSLTSDSRPVALGPAGLEACARAGEVLTELSPKTLKIARFCKLYAYPGPPQGALSNASDEPLVIALRSYLSPYLVSRTV